MATYKAEFRSHYWRRRLRPAHAYALGLIGWEARLASKAPGLANLLLRREPFATLGKRAAGIAVERTPPAFAPRTFTDWFHARGAGRGEAGSRGRVVLWADTFNDHLHPEVAAAAVETLEAAGFNVVVPERTPCCGRPLYDYGMLTLARRQLRLALDVLRPEIQAGTPVVALEPSCGAVFRDELVEMLPADEDAKRLTRLTCSLGELLDRAAPDFAPPPLRRQALVHLHCHQKATSDTACDVRVLERLGLDVEVLESGCCGLAGSFGYEAGEPYDVSMKAGERVLLPAVRDAPPEAMIVTDGFSCRSQITHGTDRGALHLAQVAQAALRGQDDGGPYPERAAPGIGSVGRARRRSAR
jgi:Fe-S oxidoreductase